ncbi:reverse transcriptase domain-containing protein [Tanacetum coccineum]
MRTRSSSNLVGNSSSNPTTSNPKRRNRRRSNQRVEPFALEESPVVTMADQRTMAELLRAPTEGYAEAIVVPPILAEHFELKHSLINMMTSDQFFGLEKDNPHDHIRWFNKITSTIKYKDVPNHAIKLMLFPFSLAGAARRWLEKEPPRSILTWEDLVSKFINEFFPPSRTTNLRNEISNFQQRFDESFHEAWDRYKDLLRACPHHGFTELHQLDTFYNALNSADQDSLNSATSGNLLERMKSNDGNSSSSDIAKLTHAVNQQTSDVTTAITAILKQFQATPPPASVKAVEEICVRFGGAHPYYQCLAADGNTFLEYRDNIQGYVAAAAGNYNQGNSSYCPPGVANQTRPSGFVQQNGQNNQNHFSQPQGFNRGNNFNQNPNCQAPIQQNQSVPLSELEKIKKMNDVNIKAMQAQINNVKNELRNEMQTSIQASMSNQTNELKNMMASFFQMNIASTLGSGSLPSNTVANPKGELKAITTRSGLVLDGPSVHMPPPFINPKEDERVEETLTDPEHGEFTIKVPPPLVQKAKHHSQQNYMVHQRDPRHPHIPYPSRMNQEKQKEKDEVQIYKFWHMFKQLYINISLADALILIPKYQKILKSLLSNKEKLIELANTPLNENCSAVILKKLPEKLGDPGKFLIPCGFSELKCKALADLGASINLMPLSVWKKLGLPELISTQMTLELANREICTPVGIARDVFVPVRKFTFPANFVIVDYKSDPRVPLILGRPFLRTARALIDVHGEEMILRDGNERLTLNMRHNTSSYSTQPHQSGNPTFSSHTNSTSLEVINLSSGNPTPISEPVTKYSSSPTLNSIKESDLIWEEFEAYLASDSFPIGNSNPSSPFPPFHNSLSGSTTSSSPSLPISETSDYSLEEFADELAIITFLPGNDDLPFDAEFDLRELEYLLNHDPIKEMDSILEDSVDKNSPNDNLVDNISEMFTDKHALDNSNPSLWDDYDDELFDLETVNDKTYDDLFDFNEEKIKDAKLLIDELDSPKSSDFLPFPECGSAFYEDFSEVNALPSTNNEDKVFNPGILIHKNLYEVTNLETMERNVKNATNASLILEDLYPPLSLYELLFHKEVLGSETLLSFSFENEEKVFNSGILTSKGVHTSLLSELSYRGPKAFKVIKIFERPMKIFPYSYGEGIRVFDVPCLHFYPP